MEAARLAHQHGVRGIGQFGDLGLRSLFPSKWHIAHYYVALALLAVAFAFSVAVIRGPLGLAFKALRDSPGYALSRGISRFKYQLWIFAVSAAIDVRDPARLLVMALLVTAWGARLTFNFARKGGYTGMEDYRWAILRGRMTPWQFQEPMKLGPKPGPLNFELKVPPAGTFPLTVTRASSIRVFPP